MFLPRLFLFYPLVRVRPHLDPQRTVKLSGLCSAKHCFALFCEMLCTGIALWADTSVRKDGIKSASTWIVCTCCGSVLRQHVVCVAGLLVDVKLHHEP
jgi:hypothetical protein